MMKLSALALCAALANGDQGTKEDMEAAGPERCYYPPLGPMAAEPHTEWCDNVYDKETCANDGGLGCTWGVKPTLEEAAAQQKVHLAQLAARHKTEAEAAQKLGTTFVKCETTKGPLDIEVHHSWAPTGAAHFLDMVNDGFYTDIALFRSVPQFVVQFGIPDTATTAGDEALRSKYAGHHNAILDDPSVGNAVARGVLCYAGGGANTRSSQLFFAYADQPHLGKQPWEVPFGKLRDKASLAVLDSFHQGYGDTVDQAALEEQGNAYIARDFPLIDFVRRCVVTGSSVNGDADDENSREDEDDANSRQEL